MSKSGPARARAHTHTHTHTRDVLVTQIRIPSVDDDGNDDDMPLRDLQLLLQRMPAEHQERHT